MADTSSVRTIKDIVQGILFQYKKPKTEYKRYYQLLIRGYMDIMRFHSGYSLKQVQLPVDSTLKSVTLPSDYESFIAIGVPSSGRLKLFVRDDRIPISTIEIGGDEVFDTDLGVGVDIGDNAFIGFGEGSNYKELYTIDERNNRIILNGFNSAEVILWYTSSGVSVTETTYIPVRFIEALEYYVLWKDIIADEGKSANRAMMYKQEYLNEIDKLRALELPTLHDFMATFLESSFPTVKR